MGQIKLNCLGFRFEGRQEDSLEDISLQVEHGETVLVAGRSGSGKSTLLHCLNGLIPEYYPGTLHGCIRIDSETASWRDTPMWQKARIVGTVFQDPRHQFFSARVEQELLLSLWEDDSSLPEKLQHIEDLLRKVGLAAFGHRLLDSLSSGEQQRVAIATALAGRPGILVLDEPSANLSGDGILGLLNFLKQAKIAGTTIIIAEHRFSWLEGLVDSLLVLDQGTIGYHGDPGKLNDSDFCQQFGLRQHIPETVHQANGQTLSREKIGNSVACLFDQVGFRYKKQNSWVFRHLNTIFHRARVTALTGRNGCGKTTLLGLIYGLHKPAEGVVDFPASRPVMALALQHPDLQLFSSTVLDEMHLVCGAGEEWLERFGLWPLRDRHPLTLSGGEMQRLVLAVACTGLSSADAPGIILLDEPTSGMDGQHLGILCEEIQKLLKKKHCVILATHDSDLITTTQAVPMEIAPG